MDSINLEVRSVLYDRLTPNHQCKVQFLTPVGCNKPIPEIWLPVEAVPLPSLIEYCQRLIQTPTRRVSGIVDRIYMLLAVSKEEELNSLLKEFRSVNGIQLPSSKKSDIMITLKNMIGKTCKVNELLLIRYDILIEKIIDKRKTISINVKKAEMQINLISDCKKPIKVRNEFDLEDFPSQLRYINKSIPYSNDIPQDVMIGCECSKNCSSACLHLDDEREFLKFDAKKGIEEHQQDLPYDEHGRILYSHKKPVYECNDFCQCDDSCPRRVVGKGANVQLEIFRTFNGCGWGVRTLEFVPKGTFITKYTGELIKWEDGDKRNNKEYLFDNDIDIDQNVGHSTYTIDAFKYGNISRFVNHSCEPNLASHVVFINNMHPDLGEIVFFSRRDIEPFEELSINYIGLVKANKDKCRCACCCNKQLVHY